MLQSLIPTLAFIKTPFPIFVPMLCAFGAGLDTFVTL